MLHMNYIRGAATIVHHNNNTMHLYTLHIHIFSIFQLH